MYHYVLFLATFNPRNYVGLYVILYSSYLRDIIVTQSSKNGLVAFYSYLSYLHTFKVADFKQARRAPHAKKPKQYITTLHNLLHKDKPIINTGNFTGATKVSFRKEKFEVLYSQYR